MTGLAKIAIPALGVLLVAGGIAGAVYLGRTLLANSDESEVVAGAGATAAPRVAIPAIDAAAPTELETATFALG